MSGVVAYESGRLRVGDTRVGILSAAFEDPELIRIMLDGRPGQPIRLLRFLLPDDQYGRARRVLSSAPGSSVKNIMLVVRTIIDGECPNLMTLLWMMHEHPDALSFDFRRFLSIDLEEALGTMSPRKLAGYAVSLPAEGSLHRAVNPDWQWGLTEQLLAGVSDQLAFLRWESAKIAGAKPGKAPKQMVRPGVKPDKDVDVLGKGEGFESIEAFDDWYAKKQARMKPAE